MVYLQFLILQIYCNFLFILMRFPNGQLKVLNRNDIDHTILLLQRFHFDWLTRSFLSVVMGQFPLSQRKTELLLYCIVLYCIVLYRNVVSCYVIQCSILFLQFLIISICK